MKSFFYSMLVGVMLVSSIAAGQPEGRRRDRRLRGRQVISTESAPAAIGPYSQAVRVGPTLYCSGQIPLDPATGQLVTGSIEEQTRRVLDNLGAVLKAAEMGFGDVVKVTVYLADWKYFSEMNEVYARFFPEPYPARTPVQAPPMGGLIMADAIVTMPEGQNQP